MEIAKASDADKEVFRAHVPDRPDVSVKPMFGNLGAFINGNMFMGLFGSAVGLRLAPGDLDEFLSIAGTGPFGPSGRPMGGYASIPTSWNKPTAASRAWVDRSLAYVEALPPKKPKPRKS